ncbi:MAG: Holliday junction resolvase RuvX [Planctomycetota bacterium]|nr:Holliday junction resolvase RuvX [Planctomycetota bacterium]
MNEPRLPPEPRLPKGPLLGVDPGTKRVGIASATLLGTVHPVCYLDAEPRDALFRRIKALAEDRQCVGLVVGLPIDMNGGEGKAAQAARAFGAELERFTGLPVAFSDERLTSHSAEKKVGELGLTRKKRKARVDAVAAALLLEGYLAEGGNSAE